VSTSVRWDTNEYQRIASAVRAGDALVVRFDDDTRVEVEAARVLPPGTRSPQWESMTVTPYEVIVPALDGEVEVPWSTIRVLADKEFSAHLAAAAAEEARYVGRRLRELRRRRNLSGKALAERAGITPQSLSRIEHGHHDIVFTTLRRILAAMDYSLKDLSSAQDRSMEGDHAQAGEGQPIR
jgi:DNA-binding Xre family transcriptional regulator